MEKPKTTPSPLLSASKGATDEKQKLYTRSKDDLVPLGEAALWRRTFTVIDCQATGKSQRQVTLPELVDLVQSHTTPNAERAAGGTLRLRDLRQILSDAWSPVPSIEVRQNCLLYNTPYIKAIIMRNRVLTISAYNLNSSKVENSRIYPRTQIKIPNLPLRDGLIADILNKEERMVNSIVALLQSPVEDSLNHIKALEVLMHLSVNTLREDLGPMVAITDKLSDENKTRPTSSIITLRRINEERKRLSELRNRSEGFLGSINYLLDDEEDLASLAFLGGPESHHSGIVELELLLENYAQEFIALQRGLLLIDERLDDTVELMEFELNTSRNHLLKADLTINVCSTIIGFFAMVTGAFGMNVGLPFALGKSEDTHAFWTIFVLCITVSIGSIYMCKRIFEKINI